MLKALSIVLVLAIAAYNSDSAKTEYVEVHFLENSLQMNEQAQKVLQGVIEILNNNPSMGIELTGHCDSGEKDPLKLSVARARMVKSFLVDAGIDERRMKVLGKGIEEVRISGSDLKDIPVEEQSQLRLRNRRVVFNAIY